MKPARFLSIIAAGLPLAAAFGQTPADAPAFEVASIKPSAPLAAAGAAGLHRIGMTVNAARVDIASMSLADLVRTAYRVKAYQVSGPGWISAERFDIQAKLPEGATKDQLPEMLQALLAERFKLAVHRENKEQSVYALVVGKNGPKLKESPPDTEALAPGGTTPSSPPNQVRVIGGEGRGVTVQGGQMGWTRMSMGSGGTMHLETGKMTTGALADLLSRFVDHPVLDMTELKGTYQVTLDLSMEELTNMAKSAGVMLPSAGGDSGRAPADAASDPSGPSIFAAVQQLGLKLEPRKAPIEVIVIDHAEKTPTEN